MALAEPVDGPAGPGGPVEVEDLTRDAPRLRCIWEPDLLRRGIDGLDPPLLHPPVPAVGLTGCAARGESALLEQADGCGQGPRLAVFDREHAVRVLVLDREGGVAALGAQRVSGHDRPLQIQAFQQWLELA